MWLNQTTSEIERVFFIQSAVYWYMWEQIWNNFTVELAKFARWNFHKLDVLGNFGTSNFHSTHFTDIKKINFMPCTI